MLNKVLTPFSLPVLLLFFSVIKQKYMESRGYADQSGIFFNKAYEFSFCLTSCSFICLAVCQVCYIINTLQDSFDFMKGQSLMRCAFT